MLFIWNGIKFKLVDDEEFEENAEKYRGYVISRRLFVSLLKPSYSKRIAEKYLHSQFKQYGAIKSIKILERRNEAFVTFISDQSAYFALMSKEKIHSEIRTEIAHPWHQPGLKDEPAQASDDDDEQMEIDEPIEPPILELPEDCLFMVFDRCNNATLVNLSETCVRFENLLQKQYRFQNIDKTLRIRKYYNDWVSITLIDLHKMVRLMGRHFDKLDFGILGHDEIFTYYIKEIVKYCKNIQHIRFHIPVFRNDFIRLLEPIFSNLLTFDNNVQDSKVDPETDLTELLPKLMKINPRSLLRNCLNKSWSSLEIFCSNRYIDEPKKIFFQLNPQIRCLELSSHGIFNLETAANHLPNIEQVKLMQFNRLTFGYLIHLRSFINLSKLDLHEIDIKNVNALRGYLNGSKNLKELRIRFFYVEILTNEHQQAIISLVKALCNIEQIDVMFQNYYYDKFNETTVVDIIRFAPKLKSLRCGIRATASLITEIVNTRKCNQRNPNKLQLYFGRNDNDFSAINENEVQKYLLIDQ